MLKNLRNVRRKLKFLNDLRFALCLLFFIALVSSIGSFIEQDQSKDFYETSYPINHPIYGFINWKLILKLGLDHIYKTKWFSFLLFLLSASLISCTLTRQFPLFFTSKEYFFKKETKSFQRLPFFIKFQDFSFLKEYIIQRLIKQNFYIYQKENFLYGYRGLIGRISPILVHLSLLFVLSGSIFGALKSFQAQEFVPKGEIFQIQNPISSGIIAQFPNFEIRVNDFWVEYQKEKIHQFYSDLSILGSNGTEKKNYTISVNNPLKYSNTDIYQSDWNLIGIRTKIDLTTPNNGTSQNFSNSDFPLFPLKENNKYWITWINDQNKFQKNLKQQKGIREEKIKDKNYYLVFDQFQEDFLKYDEKGKILKRFNLGEQLDDNLIVTEIIPTTGLLIKSDPSIPIMYFGFGLLMITTFLSLLPYNQIWVFEESLKKNRNSENTAKVHKSTSFFYFGANSNRGKIQFEIEFENFIRELKNMVFLIKREYFQ